MRYVRYIAVSLLLLFPAVLPACIPPSFSPEGYWMFRISDNYMHGNNSPFSNRYGDEMNENCELWRRQTGTDASVCDIRRVVYEASADEIAALLCQKPTPSSLRIDTNAFAATLRLDREAAEMLLLAKQCEAVRGEMASPWYYPSRRDPHRLSLEQVVDKAMAYRGARFGSRYALQIARALLSLRRYDECINWWNAVKEELPDDIVKRMALRYVAGSYCRIGEKEEARRLYGQAGDYESILLLADGDELAAVEAVYAYAPEAQALRDWVERRIILAELDSEPYDVRTGRILAPELSPEDAEPLKAIRRFCMKVAGEGRVSDPALWYYTAAFIDHLSGDNAIASRTLARAERSGGTPFINESIHVFRIYLDAALLPCSLSYEADMVARLRWLDSKLVSDLPANTDRIAASNPVGAVNAGYSVYYWSDMLRKVIYTSICPKLVAAGRQPQALAFAEMADNRMLSLLREVDRIKGCPYSLEQYRASQYHNYHDYQVPSFTMAETMPLESLMEYVRILERPSTEAERFLRDRGNPDPTYFRDIIGTRLIREMRYVEAARWLASVPPSFQGKLNTCKDGYMDFDPFSLKTARLQDNGDYKYAFAREMASLEREIASAEDPDRRARLMMRMATGMKNSVTSCWALSFYRKSCEDTDDDPGSPTTPFLTAQEKVLDRAGNLFDRALATAASPGAKAEILLEYGDVRTLMNRYPGTDAAAYAKARCDTYADYHLDRYYIK